MSIGQRIDRIFLESLNIAVPSPATDIIDAGLLDSLTFVMLLCELEEQFEIKLPLDTVDIDRLRTTESIAGLVGELVAGAEFGRELEVAQRR